MNHRLLPHRSPPLAQRTKATPPRPAFAVTTPKLIEPADTRLTEQLGKGQALAWPSLYFAQGRADLLPAVQVSLDTLATILRQQPGLRLQVQGHTDNQGDSTLNRQLSQRRAEAVCRYLVASGIAEARLQAKGYGGSQPVADNRMPTLRPRNRRVVLQPLP